MKVSHTKLESARTDIKSILVSGAGYGTGRYGLWQNAIGHYHKSNQDSTVATSYIANSFSRFKSGPKAYRELDFYLDCFHSYAKDFKKLNNTVLKTATNIDMDIDYGNRLGGRLNRIDQTKKNGIAVYLYLKENVLWTKELRFPLIQKYAADYFKVDLKKVAVGVFSLESFKHEAVTFSKEDVEIALEEVNDISNRLTEII